MSESDKHEAPERIWLQGFDRGWAYASVTSNRSLLRDSDTAYVRADISRPVPADKHVDYYSIRVSNDSFDIFEPDGNVIASFTDDVDAEVWCDTLNEAYRKGQESVCLPAREDAQIEFAEWLSREMPAGTVIGDPGWWAGRIFQAVHTAVEQSK